MRVGQDLFHPNVENEALPRSDRILNDEGVIKATEQVKKSLYPESIECPEEYHISQIRWDHHHQSQS